MVRHVEVVSTATTTVVEVMEAAAMTTVTVGLHATMIASVVLMGVVTIMALVALIAMLHQDVKTAIAAVEMIDAAVMSLTAVEMADGRAIMQLMRSLRLQGTLEIPMVEVEPKTTILMIGTLVDRLRSANLLRCGALCEITRPNLSSFPKLSTSYTLALRGDGLSIYALALLRIVYLITAFAGAFVAADQLSKGEFSAQAKSVNLILFSTAQRG